MVHVFRRPAADWIPDEVLTSPEPGPNQRFGGTVVADYDLVLVREVIGTYPSTYAEIHVFRCVDACEWMQTLSGGGSLFGNSLAIAREDLIAIGDSGGGAYGRVLLYRENPETGLFAPHATLTPSGPRAESEGFGGAVAATRYHVFVGEPGLVVEGAPQKGAVHVYSADLNESCVSRRPRLRTCPNYEARPNGAMRHPGETPGSLSRSAQARVST